MANLLAGGKDYERVDSITGTANAEGPVLVIEATSRWSGTDNRQKAAIDAVALLAKASWDEKNFGATLADGTGAVGLQFISDGRTYNITGKQMKQVAEMTLSARAAMGL